MRAARVLAAVVLLVSSEACGWMIGDAATLYVSPDAGDASFEAGPSEAGPSEAGPSEAGPSEAGPSEAGPPQDAGGDSEAAVDGAGPPADPALGLAAWGNHVCAVRSSGTVACWGDNTAGVLNDGSNYWTFTPTKVLSVTSVPIADAVQVAVGYEHGCARAGNGAITCWGNPGHLATGTYDGTVSGGGWLGAKGWYFTEDGDPWGDFNCTLDATQQVLCWGSNTHNALGHAPGTMGDTPCDLIGGTYYNSCNTIPVPVAGLPAITRAALDDGGGCALTATGNVACWGWNGEGQLGSVGGVDSPTPVTILMSDGQPLSDVKDLYGGHNLFCALQSTGRLYCWGHTYEYETGLAADGGSSTAVPVEFDNGAIPGITGATIGQIHACVIAGTNVWCAGSNANYEVGTGVSVGNGEGGTYFVADPGKVLLAPDGSEPLARVVEVVAGWNSTCARNSDGVVYCWGANNLGQTGHQPGTLGDVICGPGYCTPFATRVDTF